MNNGSQGFYLCEPQINQVKISFKKIKNMKKQIIIGVSLLVFGSLKAQYIPKHYLHFDIGGGLHSLEYNLQNGTQKGQFGYTVDAAYSYFFKQNWGVKVGVGIQSYAAQSTLNYLSSIPTVDTNGDLGDFKTNYNNWQEMQQALFLDIPLEVQYRHFFSEKISLLASLGAKVSIPIVASYKTNGEAIATTGYYSQWNVELYNLPQHGFSANTNNYSGGLSLKTAYVGIADVGCLYSLSKQMSLYMGAYLNYSLNNILTPDTKQIYQPDGVYNGIFASNQLTKVNPLAVGVKVGLTWQLKDRWLVVRKHAEQNGNNSYINTEHLKIKDSDGDGVPDKLDKCPNTPKEAKGFVDKNGCPLDTDGDGVPDYLDKDNHTPSGVKVDAMGIPLDSDGDGVPDYLDKSPNTPKEAKGFVDANGIPLDTDGDGVPDYLDKDNHTPSGVKVDAVGIPLDSDGDGVPDYLDKYPNTPKEAKGFVDVNGCPLDTDGDGVPDYLDKCPRLAGVASNNGCPEVKKEVRTLLKKALKGISFEAGKSTITKDSYNVLDKIVLVFKSNPTYLAEVQGHSDSEGTAELNKILSQKRANEVRTYLIKHGIDEKRLKAVGYGDTMPMGDNNTVEGRALNRRVEFIVSFEEVSFK